MTWEEIEEAFETSNIRLAVIVDIICRNHTIGLNMKVPEMNEISCEEAYEYFTGTRYTAKQIIDIYSQTGTLIIN